MEAGLRSHLLAPDGRALLADGRAATPLTLAGAALGAMCGGGIFGAVLCLAAAMADPGSLSAGSISTLPGLLLAPALAALLTLPPLYLIHALRQREGDLHQLIAAVSVGPTVCGAWLLAGSPLLLLYALTGTANVGFYVLAFLLASMSFGAGGIAATKIARRNPRVSPSAAALTAHHALFFWTTGLLAVHLT